MSKVSTHPPYEVMIATAIKAIKDRKGASSVAIAKYLEANYELPEGFKKRMSLQLKKLVESEKLIKDKVRFKLGEVLKAPPKKKKPAPKKKKPAPKKKPAAKKTVKKTVKKPAAKKPAAKKTVKKPAAKKKVVKK